MIDDPIVEEVRSHRQAHAARYNYDLEAIFEALLEREKNSSRPVVNRPPRRITESPKADIPPQFVLGHNSSLPRIAPDG
jgi:hypothetical protein